MEEQQDIRAVVREVIEDFFKGEHAEERKQSLGGRVIGAQAPAFSAPVQRSESPSLTPWVSAPASAPDADRVSTQTVSIPPHPGVGSWLQAPMRSSGVSPWRKVMRWLQAPAGH